MAKLRYWISFGYRIIAGAIAGATLGLQFNSLGLNAWRDLVTWVVLAASIYFFWSAFISWFHRKQPMPQPATYPLLQGFVLVSGVGLFILRLVYQNIQIGWVGTQDSVAFLAIFFLPILMFCDWLFFTKKGSWSTSHPFYWLGIIISYCCAILLTASFLSAQNAWAYPYAFLNYPLYGLDNLLRCGVLIVVVVLLIGYVFMLLDYVASGQLGKHIVLPRIKTIVIEEPAIVEPEVVTLAEAKQLQRQKDPYAKVENQPKPKSEPKPQSKPQEVKLQPKPASSKPKNSSMDIVKPVEGLKDQKSAQKLHRSSKSKSEIIADMRLQVAGNKNTKSRPRPQARPNSKNTKKA